MHLKLSRRALLAHTSASVDRLFWTTHCGSVQHVRSSFNRVAHAPSITPSLGFGSVSFWQAVRPATGVVRQDACAEMQAAAQSAPGPKQLVKAFVKSVLHAWSAFVRQLRRAALDFEMQSRVRLVSAWAVPATAMKPTRATRASRRVMTAPPSRCGANPGVPKHLNSMENPAVRALQPRAGLQLRGSIGRSGADQSCGSIASALQTFRPGPGS